MKKIFAFLLQIISFIILGALIYTSFSFFSLQKQGCPAFSKWSTPIFCSYNLPTRENKFPEGVVNTKKFLIVFFALGVVSFGAFRLGKKFKK